MKTELILILCVMSGLTMFLLLTFALGHFFDWIGMDRENIFFAGMVFLLIGILLTGARLGMDKKTSKETTEVSE